MTPTTHAKRLPFRAQGKLIYILVSVIMFNILFPISTLGDVPEIIYYFFYSLLFIVSVYLLGSTRLNTSLAAVTGVYSFILGIINSFLPAQTPTSALLWTIGLVIMQMTLIIALLQFIFEADTVDSDVLLAAVTAYLVLGTLFVPIYTVLEVASPGSFSINVGTYEIVGWQNFLYFSYATLTTLGYGDITPISPVAQSLAITETITGVLYTTILISRLVGLYSQRTKIVVIEEQG